MPNVFAGRIDVDQRAIVFNFEHVDSLACSILNRLPFASRIIALAWHPSIDVNPSTVAAR